MPAPPDKNKFALGILRVVELFETWWQHRVSFLISLIITLAALTLYYFTFFGERATPIFAFLQRFEYDSLDTRFRYRPPTKIDQDIVIVDIDQHSQEVLGHWPFSRIHFANLLDILRSDGATVAAFDITFSKPEVSAASVQAFEKALQARKSRMERVDRNLAAELQGLAAGSNADKQFAKAIQKFGSVVLGNYFLYTESDLRDIDSAVLDAYAQQLSFFSFPQVQSVKNRAAFGKQDRANLIAKYQISHPLPQGAEANLDIFTNALSGASSGTG